MCRDLSMKQLKAVGCRVPVQRYAGGAAASFRTAEYKPQEIWAVQDLPDQPCVIFLIRPPHCTFNLGLLQCRTHEYCLCESGAELQRRCTVLSSSKQMPCASFVSGRKLLKFNFLKKVVISQLRYCSGTLVLQRYSPIQENENGTQQAPFNLQKFT